MEESEPNVQVSDSDDERLLAGSDCEGEEHQAEVAPGDPDDSDTDETSDEDIDDPRGARNNGRRYTVDEMLSFMDMYRLVRNFEKVDEVLKASARALLPRADAVQIADEIDRGWRPVPHRTSVSRALLRADRILMLWRRVQTDVEGFRVTRFITPDSSPQGGFDYYMINEVIMVRDLDHPILRGCPLAGFTWERRVLPVSCFGSRDMGAVHKTVKLQQSASLESGDSFPKWRSQVGGFLSDQGAERKVATAALLIDQDTSVREAMDKVERGEVSYDDPGVHGLQFLPEAIEHIGHKHLLYNSLKESVIKQPEHDSWKQTLNAFLHLIFAPSSSAPRPPTHRCQRCTASRTSCGSSPSA